MKPKAPLEEVQFLRRYKRFFADVELASGEILTVHVPNTGSLKGLIETPRPAMISRSSSPERKLKGTLEMIRSEKSWVGVNTQTPSALMREALGNLPSSLWHEWTHFQAEVPLHEKTRIDFVLHNGADKLGTSHFREKHSEKYHLIEVKNVTMAEGEVALFPDAPSERALKHLYELLDQKQKGATVEMVYVIQREDCSFFSPAKEIHAKYAESLQEAYEKGLKITPLKCRLTAQEIVLEQDPLPLSW